MSKPEPLEVQRVREEMGNYQRNGCKDCELVKPWTMACGYEHRSSYLCPKDINFILSKVLIEADDQSLPEYPVFCCNHCEKNMKQAQQDMLTPKDGYKWVRVVDNG